MNSVEPQKPQSIQYPSRTAERAERALRCSPFRLNLFSAMRSQSIELKAIASSSGVENGYASSPVAELAAENYLLWLIQVGVLRREVDGQGITDSFRLTPLGRQLVEKWEQQGGCLPPPSGSDRLTNQIGRWFRLPF
ncbi:MAG: Npun_F0494 family protein [Actinomycetota bacterium]